MDSVMPKRDSSKYVYVVEYHHWSESFVDSVWSTYKKALVRLDSFGSPASNSRNSYRIRERMVDESRS